MDEYGETYTVHPDTGAIYKGFNLPEWTNALKICTSASLLFPEMKYKSIDLAYSKKGWIIVEINPSGELLQQACMQKGMKNQLKEIMQKMDLMCSYSLR